MSIVQRLRNPRSVDLNFNEKEKGGRSRVSFTASLKSLAVNSFRKISSYISDSFFTFCISSRTSLIPFSNLINYYGPQFPDSSVGKESTCNAGDPNSIPGLGRAAGEGTGYPRQYSWASLVAQRVKNLPAMWETWVWSLGWGDPLEKETATHSSILAWRIPWTIQAMGLQRVGQTECLSYHFTS